MKRKMYLRTLALMTLFGVGAVNVYADSSASIKVDGIESMQQQKKVIKGIVKDNAGDPLIGVNVYNRSSGVGTITNIDGEFNLEVKAGDEVELSYIGYTPQKIKITTSTTNINITLVEDTEVLDEVVVTALGIKRSQKALSYNVQEVKGEELLGVKDVNFVNSLSGKIAGVNINSSSAGMGGATRVVMRGTKSLTKDNNALYVIDGVPIFNANGGGLSQNNEYADQPRGEGISDLNPEDIESMSVLTGPSAAALYGSSAANGVIIITTKKGVAGKPKITITNQTMFSNPLTKPKLQSTYGAGLDVESGKKLYRSWGDKTTAGSFKPSDFFDTGVTAQTSASLSVGSEKNQTYLSLGSANSSGIIPKSSYDKYNITVRNTTKFLDDKMTLDFGLSYIKQKDKNLIAQGKYGNPLTTIYTYPRGENFGLLNDYEKFDQLKGYDVQRWEEYGWGDEGLEMQNPYWVLNRNPKTNKKDRYMMNVNLSYDVLDWLNLSGRMRLDNSNNKMQNKYYASTRRTFAPENGRYKMVKEEYKQYYADFLVNINKHWDEEWSLSSNIGTSFSDIRSEGIGADGELLIPNFFALTNINKDYGKTEFIEQGWHEQTQSIFANVELGWRSMLYLTVTGRNDWASALANTSKKSFFYPSVGLSAILSEMFTLPEAVSYLQVRGSFASVGSPIPRSLSIPTYKWDAQGNSWETNSYMPIDDLKPERTDSWELGLSSKFWGNRLTFDFTWYRSNTKNQTFQIPISPSSGYTSMFIQTGNVRNQGVEMALGTNNTWGNFSWNSNLTASFNSNKITKLIEDGEFKDPQGNAINFEQMSQDGIGSSEFILKKGGSMGDLYTKNQFDRDDFGNIKLTAEGSPQTKNEFVKEGSVLPKWNLGFRNDFRYKDITLGVMLSARLGGIVLSPTEAILDGFGVSKRSAEARDKGGIPNGTSHIDPEKYYKTIGQTGGVLGEYVYSASNVRLQELSLGYYLPNKWFNDIAKVHVAFIGRNLWMIYNKAPFDPEVTASTGTYFQGVDYFMQPATRNLGFSVRVEF